MAITGRLAATAGAAPTAGVISVERGGVLTATFSGAGASDLPYRVAVGSSGGVPATYSDLNSPVEGPPPLAEGSVTYKYHLTGDTYDVVVTLPLGPSSFTLGDALYALLFVNKPTEPDPTDVPDGVAGPIAVVA